MKATPLHRIAANEAVQANSMCPTWGRRRTGFSPQRAQRTRRGPRDRPDSLLSLSAFSALSAVKNMRLFAPSVVGLRQPLRRLHETQEFPAMALLIRPLGGARPAVNVGVARFAAIGGIAQEHREGRRRRRETEVARRRVKRTAIPGDDH